MSVDGVVGGLGRGEVPKSSRTLTAETVTLLDPVMYLLFVQENAEREHDFGRHRVGKRTERKEKTLWSHKISGSNRASNHTKWLNKWLIPPK